MAIRFSCAQCFKVHRVPDRCAGLPGRCGRCGYRFVAPGMPRQVPSPIFVPAAAPNPFAVARTPRSGTAQAIACGLALATIAVVGMFLGRDRIAAAVPALAHMLPPKAAPAPPTPRPAAMAPIAGRWEFDYDAAGEVSLWIAYFSVGVVLPLVVPPVLSRKGYLSVGRWLIFAGLAFFLLSTLGAVYEAELRRTFGLPSPNIRLLMGAALPLLHAIVGCAIAAAIHPKTPPAGQP